MTTEFLNEIFSTEACLELNAANPTIIEWSDAVQWTKRFREVHGETQLFNGRQIKGYVMSRGNLEDLLYQDGLALQGVKIYLGLDEKGVFRLIIIGVQGKNGNDYKVPANGTVLASTTDDELPSIGEPRPCPEWCGPPNVLNEG